MKPYLNFKKVKTVTFLFLLLTSFVNAQNLTLTGKVVDNNNQPLLGATVLIKGTLQGVSTDSDGNFKLQLPNGVHTLKISFIGYSTVEKTIDVNQNTSITIQLLEAENFLDEVLVSAVRANTNTPVTYSNITKKEISKRNLGQDIPILLNYMPSVVSSSDAGAGVGYTYMNIRGSNSERINVTINGIPYNDSESHGTFWVNLGDFASSTQNLQVQRGVGTSTNGAGAFGASINILSEAFSDEAYGELSNSFGSFGTRKHTLKFSTGILKNHIEISGRLSNIYSDGYVDRAYTDLKSYFLQAAYKDNNTLIKAITFGGKEKTYQAWYGLTAEQLEQDRRQNPYTYENEIDNYQQDHYQLHWNEQLNENWSSQLSFNFTQGAGYFEQYKENEDIALFGSLVDDVNNDGETDAIVRRWLDNDFYFTSFNSSYKNKNLEIVSGVSYGSYTNDHFGELIWGNELASTTSIRDHYYNSNSSKTDFSVFAKATFSINEKLLAFIDLQGRFIGYKTKGLTSDITPIDVDTNFSFFNPKAGLTYTIKPKSKLYLSYARANREPNRNDFEGGVTTHETLDDIELGWRFSGENITLNSNIYYMNYKNQLVLTGAIDDVGEPVRATSGKSYRLGIELEADIRVSESFHIKPNLAISQNKNKDFHTTIDGLLQNLGDTPLSFSPSTVIGNAFVYAPTEKLQVSVLSKFVGKQYMSNLNSVVSELDVLDSYFTSDLNISYTINPKNLFKQITITGLINNVFNNKYVDRGYYGTYDDTWSSPTTITTLDYSGYYPQATLNFLAGVTLRF